MTRLAQRLGGLAAAVLPRSRKAWGAAMTAEIDTIADDGTAARFAAGCLIAGLRARASDHETRFAAGLWSLSLASAGFALFHISCAWGGAKILLGGPDLLRDALLRSDPATAIAYRGAVPFVAGLFLLLGIAHLGSAYLLARGRLRAFFAVWRAALAIATLAVAVQLSVVWTLDGLPSEFLAPLIQATGVLALWSTRQMGESR